MPGPGQMHRACLSSFERVFVDDAGQLETVKTLTGNVGHRLYAAFKANAHRADIFRYVDHYLRGGLYLDIKTALLEPLEPIQERIVAEFKPDASLIAHAANLYGWDPAALAASGPPDYFMTAIGTRKDHIFQHILLGRPRHPLMLAALHHCFGPTLVDQQGPQRLQVHGFLRRTVSSDQGGPLSGGRDSSESRLGPGLWSGPIYLLQETHEPALKTAQPKGLPNDGHCFRAAGGQMVALTRCWKWNKGWKGDAAGKQAQHDRRAGNPVEFATDAGLQNHYLRQSGASRNWHHASQAAYDQRLQQARASATGTGTAGAPNPKDESGTQAPPPTETIVPYERAKAPEPEPSRQRTIAELCSFVGDSPYTGKVVNSEKGRLTIATTTKTRNQAGQVLREEEQVSEANFKLFALAFQTIYDAAAKRAHNSTRCVMHYATGNSEEEGATLKLTHGETAFQKFRAVTGLEPSRVLAPAGAPGRLAPIPRQNQREAEDDNRWYWHEDRRAAPKRPWQPTLLEYVSENLTGFLMPKGQHNSPVDLVKISKAEDGKALVLEHLLDVKRMKCFPYRGAWKRSEVSNHGTYTPAFRRLAYGDCKTKNVMITGLPQIAGSSAGELDTSYRFVEFETNGVSFLVKAPADAQKDGKNVELAHKNWYYQNEIKALTTYAKMVLGKVDTFVLALQRSGKIHEAARLGRIPREIVFAVAKGMYGRSKRCFKLASVRVMKELNHLYWMRIKKRKQMRILWITRINAAAISAGELQEFMQLSIFASREHGLAYSRLITGLSRANMYVDRKSLCHLAETEPVSFKCIVDEAKRTVRPQSMEWVRNLSSGSVEKFCVRLPSVVESSPESILEKQPEVEEAANRRLGRVVSLIKQVQDAVAKGDSGPWVLQWQQGPLILGKYELVSQAEQEMFCDDARDFSSFVHISRCCHPSSEPSRGLVATEAAGLMHPQLLVLLTFWHAAASQRPHGFSRHGDLRADANKVQSVQQGPGPFSPEAEALLKARSDQALTTQRWEHWSPSRSEVLTRLYSARKFGPHWADSVQAVHHRSSHEGLAMMFWGLASAEWCFASLVLGFLLVMVDASDADSHKQCLYCM
eukprot:s4925_g3.t3